MPQAQTVLSVETRSGATVKPRGPGRPPVHGRRRSVEELRGLREAYNRVMYDALIDSVELFRNSATDAERQEEDKLLKEAREASDDDHPAVIERLWMLERSVEARRDASRALAAGDREGSERIQNTHWLWTQRMTAVREALDEVGLHPARFSINGPDVHVSVAGPDTPTLQAKRSALMPIIRRQLRGIKVNVRCSLWYPLEPSESWSNHG